MDITAPLMGLLGAPPIAIPPFAPRPRIRSVAQLRPRLVLLRPLAFALRPSLALTLLHPWL
eukprot:5844413-Alexandrium_andersonii.AAC.1